MVVLLLHLLFEVHAISNLGAQLKDDPEVD